jgi:hypothetical protein
MLSRSRCRVCLMRRGGDDRQSGCRLTRCRDVQTAAGVEPSTEARSCADATRVTFFRAVSAGNLLGEPASIPGLRQGALASLLFAVECGNALHQLLQWRVLMTQRPTERDYLRRIDRQLHFRSRGVPRSVQVAILIVIALITLKTCIEANAQRYEPPVATPPPLTYYHGFTFPTRPLYAQVCSISEVPVTGKVSCLLNKGGD